MKKTLIALAAVAATSAAFAQSSVTLFGIVDLNVRDVSEKLNGVKNNAASITSMSQDGIASSRLGVRGVEDLGGGIGFSQVAVFCGRPVRVDITDGLRWHRSTVQGQPHRLRHGAGIGLGHMGAVAVGAKPDDLAQNPGTTRLGMP